MSSSVDIICGDGAAQHSLLEHVNDYISQITECEEAEARRPWLERVCARSGSTEDHEGMNE